MKSKQSGGGKLFQDAIEGAEEVRDPFDIAILPSFEVRLLPKTVDILYGQSVFEVRAERGGQGVLSSD